MRKKIKRRQGVGTRFIASIEGCTGIQISLFSTNGLRRAGEPRPYLDTSNIRGIRDYSGLFIFVKVGARSPRPHLVDRFFDIFPAPRPQAT